MRSVFSNDRKLPEMPTRLLNTIRGCAMQEISLSLQVTTIVLGASRVNLLFFSMRILQGRKAG
jgi:hypothetical protein